MLAAVEMNMSSRIIRGNEDSRSVRVTAGGMGVPGGHAPLTNDTSKVEKRAFENGYKEGERIGKQMGERLIEDTVSRYERSIQQLAGAERKLSEAMEAETVRLSLQIARKIISREAAIDPEMVSVLVSVALKRMQGHHRIEVRVSRHDIARVSEAVRSAGSSIPVKEDPALERGDFMLDSIETHIDGRISSQVEAVSRALFDE
jgi:flagellar assembly protein FliH